MGKAYNSHAIVSKLPSSLLLMPKYFRFIGCIMLTLWSHKEIIVFYISSCVCVCVCACQFNDMHRIRDL